MSERELSAEFDNLERAESAIGRLEVLGVPSHKITKNVVAKNNIVVTADVQDRLTEKAALILQGN